MTKVPFGETFEFAGLTFREDQRGRYKCSIEGTALSVWADFRLDMCLLQFSLELPIDDEKLSFGFVIDANAPRAEDEARWRLRKISESLFGAAAKTGVLCELMTRRVL